MGFVLKYPVKITGMINVYSFGDQIGSKREVNSSNECDDWVNEHAVSTHGEDNLPCVTDSAFVLQ